MLQHCCILFLLLLFASVSAIFISEYRCVVFFFFLTEDLQCGGITCNKTRDKNRPPAGPERGKCSPWWMCVSVQFRTQCALEQAFSNKLVACPSMSRPDCCECFIVSCKVCFLTYPGAEYGWPTFAHITLWGGSRMSGCLLFFLFCQN